VTLTSKVAMAGSKIGERRRHSNNASLILMAD
jgi:hypothetical protein